MSALRTTVAVPVDQASPFNDVLDIADITDRQTGGADVHSSVRVYKSSPGAKPCHRQSSSPPQLDANSSIAFDRDCAVFNITLQQPSFLGEFCNYEMRSGICSRFSRRTGGRLVPVVEIRIRWIRRADCTLIGGKASHPVFSIRDLLTSGTVRQLRITVVRPL